MLFISLTFIIIEESRRCIYCDHKFIVDELDPEYKCGFCRKNNVTIFINTRWLPF